MEKKLFIISKKDAEYLLRTLEVANDEGYGFHITLKLYHALEKFVG